ncbi:MAG TPA: TolC family protein [Ignavibacteriales bacterium]|nr:TolC family protein [Ignavibacteriales bacterium]
MTLDESKQLTLENNTSVKNGRLEIEAAKQTRKAAFTQYFPTIKAIGVMFEAQENLMEIKTAGGNLPVYDGNPVNLLNPTQFAYMPPSTIGLLKKGTFGSIMAVQPLFAGGRIINGNKLAALGRDVSEEKTKLAVDDALIKTEESYWQIVSLEEKHNTILKYEELLNSLYKQVDDAYTHGITSKNDLLKVKLKKSEVALNKSKLENGIKLAKMAFCQHIGIEYDSTLALTDTLTVQGLPESYYVDNVEALKLRTEYKLLQRSIRAEELKTNMKLGEYLPQAGIGVSGSYTKLDDSDSRTLGMVFGIVQVPVSGWWEASHTLKERSLQEQMAKNNLKENSELLTLQMEKAWQDLTDSYKQYLMTEDALAQAEENLEVNEDSYNNGLIGVSDLLEAQALLLQTHNEVTESKAGYRNKQVSYLRATGRDIKVK